jgi:hypothetical protein
VELRTFSTLAALTWRASQKPSKLCFHAQKVNFESQLCIVQEIRNSLAFTGWKDRKTMATDLKQIYGAPSLDDAEYQAEYQLEYQAEVFREKYGERHPAILRSRDDNRAEPSVFFKYPDTVRRLIYTTNDLHHKSGRGLPSYVAEIYQNSYAVSRGRFLNQVRLYVHFRNP